MTLVSSSSQLGAVLANRRVALQLSQLYVAELAGLSRRALQQIESGKANPSLTSMLAVMKVLGLQLTIEKRLTDENPVR